MKKTKKVALVLGAGGARGFAHIGVIEELTRHNINIDLIVGSSIGSLIGALYADSEDISSLKQKMTDFKKHHVLDFSIINSLQFFTHSKAPLKGSKLKKYITKNLSVTNIEELKIPLKIIATNIQNGEPVMFDGGDIVQAVFSSCALPPLFAPNKYQGMELIDGGLCLPLPVSVALSFDVIIAIDISNTLINKKISNMIDVMYKAKTINYHWLCKEQGKEAHIVIKPNLEEFDILDTKYAITMYERGIAATKSKINEILALVS